LRADASLGVGINSAGRRILPRSRHYSVNKSLQPDRIMNQLIPGTLSCTLLFNMRFNIILIYTPRTTKSLAFKYFE
jgi:hypothetical protein